MTKTVTCQNCEKEFTPSNRRGPKPKFCSAACKQANHRDKEPDPPDPVSEPPPPTPQPEQRPLTLRDVVNLAEKPLSVKQCDVVIAAFTKARARAARRERSS